MVERLTSIASVAVIVDKPDVGDAFFLQSRASNTHRPKPDNILNDVETFNSFPIGELRTQVNSSSQDSLSELEINFAIPIAFLV